MKFIGEIVTLLVLVLGVGATLVLAAAWTRHFADLLWRLVMAPRIVSATAVFAMLLAGAVTYSVAPINLVGPLAFSIQLIAVPFVAVPLSDFLAYFVAVRRSHFPSGIGWRGYIFVSRRLAQRTAYAAPRSEQYQHEQLWMIETRVG